MSIFDKKTNEPISSEELARRVEEYNRKFIASQEPQFQPTTRQHDSSVQSSQPPHRPSSSDQHPLDENGLRIVSDKMYAAAKDNLEDFVFENLNDQVAKEIILHGYNGREPSKELLAASSQFFNMIYDVVFDKSYTPEIAKRDLLNLAAYIAENDSFPMLQLMAAYPPYAVFWMGKNLEYNGFPEETANKMVDELYKFSEPIQKGIKKRLETMEE